MRMGFHGWVCGLVLAAFAPAPASSQVVVYSDGFENAPACAPPEGMFVVPAQFSSLFGPWPYYNGPRRLEMPAGSYMAIRFTASQVAGQYGTFDGSGGYPGDGAGAAMMSISTMPGCFNPAMLAPNCYSAPTPVPGISWSNGGVGFTCALDRDAVYYLNITFGPTTNGAFCSGNVCGRDFANVQAVMEP